MLQCKIKFKISQTLVFSPFTKEELQSYLRNFTTSVQFNDNKSILPELLNKCINGEL